MSLDLTMISDLNLRVSHTRDLLTKNGCGLREKGKCTISDKCCYNNPRTCRVYQLIVSEAGRANYAEEKL